MGNVEESIPLFEEVDTVRKTHNKLLGARQLLREAYARAKRVDEFNVVVAEDIKDARENLPPNSLQLSNVLVLIGMDLNRIGDYVQAVEILQESYGIRKRHIPELWVTFNTESELGAAYLGLKQYEKALPFLEEGFAGLLQRKNEIPAQFKKQRLTNAVERLLQIAELTNDSSAAARWKKELQSLAL